MKRLGIGALALSATAFVGILVREDYRGDAYVPTKGDVPTVGFGTTSRPDGAPVQMGDTTTPVDAVKRAARDVTRFEGAVKRCVKVPLHQYEYDAYVSMTYNIGEAAFCGSTMVKRLNAGDYAGACEAVLMWKRVAAQDCSVPGNRICWGLWLDRQRTRAQCLGE